MVKKNTHDALITDTEAEVLITHLETSSKSQAISKARAAGSGHLLTGLLKAPDGQAWEGSGKYYRLRSKDNNKGRYI